MPLRNNNEVSKKYTKSYKNHNTMKATAYVCVLAKGNVKWRELEEKYTQTVSQVREVDRCSCRSEYSPYCACMCNSVML